MFTEAAWTHYIMRRPVWQYVYSHMSGHNALLKEINQAKGAIAEFVHGGAGRIPPW
jgi:hypothetical protein